MNSIALSKRTDSFAWFTEGQRLFAGSTYAVSVDAPEFRVDTESSARVVVKAGGEGRAECALVPDPLRRGLRRGVLVAPADGADSLVVELAGNTILMMDIVATSGPGSSQAPSESRWTVVDLGVVTSGAVQVADMTQVKLSAAPMDDVLGIAPVGTGDTFDAYVAVSAAGGSATRFPFTGVFVGGSVPTWSHQDSLTMPARRWILHVVKVAGEYYADLRAGRPGGTEVDPDGDAVVSAEVNR